MVRLYLPYFVKFRAFRGKSVFVLWPQSFTVIFLHKMVLRFMPSSSG